MTEVPHIMHKVPHIYYVESTAYNGNYTARHRPFVNRR